MSGKLAVFNLPEDVRENEVEELFSKYGRLSRCCVRQTKGGDTMAFIEYDDPRDAEDAKESRHGYEWEDRKLRVEFSQPKGKGKDRGDSRRRGRRDSRPSRRDSRRRDSRGRGMKGKGKGDFKGSKGKGKGLRDSYHKVEVVGMPPSASWQDVKDFLRRAGNVRFTDVDPDRRDVGIGGFEREEEARAAAKELDQQTFTARDGEKARVDVVYVDPNSGSGGGDDRKRSRSRGRDSRSRGR
ncbi:unnamed protein product [Amoebophrya sp. A25]|nr:unnamed protein product [Amoebophrya sp. A25]|eukprot:GSA25T00003447001.1